MNNDQVAHLWANQSKPHAKGSNFFFDGKTIYSYGQHFPIATLVPFKIKEGRKTTERTIALFERATYSVSTTRHQSIARQACSHLETFEVDLRHSWNGLGYDIKKAFEAYSKQSEESMVKASRARTYKDSHLRDAHNAIEKANRLLVLFRKELPYVRKLKPLDNESIERLNDQAKAKRRKEIQANRTMEQAWLDHETDSLPRGHRYLIRKRKSQFLPQGEHVETSHGARIPLDDAKTFYKVISRFRATPEECPSMSVSHFHLNKLSSQGARIGCHFLAWSIMDQFAKSIGLEVAS
tara:strand:+ start:3452 stop:4336 length:885 start_codon:yes stop_codon:yes gene_type:complete